MVLEKVPLPVEDVEPVYVEPFNEPIIVEVIEEDDSEYEDLVENEVITLGEDVGTGDNMLNHLVAEVINANEALAIIFGQPVQIIAPAHEYEGNENNEFSDEDVLMEQGYSDDTYQEHLSYQEQAASTEVSSDSLFSIEHNSEVACNTIAQQSSCSSKSQPQTSATPTLKLGRKKSKYGYRRKMVSYKGKKHLRRKRNSEFLNEMKEETDEESTDCDSKRHTGLSSIFHNQQAYQLWSAFTQLSESAQNSLLESFSNRSHRNVPSSCVGTCSNPSTSSTLTNHEAFLNLSSTQRDFISQLNFPLGIVEYLEHAVVLHFRNSPTQVYVSEEVNSFERLILHSLAAYYSLDSESVNVSDTQHRVTRINNGRGAFHVPATTLTEYLEQMRDSSR